MSKQQPEIKKHQSNNHIQPWWRRRKKHAPATVQPAKPVERLPEPSKTQAVRGPNSSQNCPNRPQNSPGQPVRSTTTPNNYAFIDSQNLNLGVQKSGWKMDWHKFRLWLGENYGVTQAYMFIGYMSENETLYQQMYDHGFLVVLKPTLEIMQVDKPGDKPRDEKDKLPVKGNIDADLVLHAMKELPNYDKAIIVSGDGDFYGLAEHLISQGKLLKIMAPNYRYSTLLKPFEAYIENLENHSRELSYRTFNKRPRKS